MLTYTFDKNDTLCLYERLYRNIKNDILNGNLKSGEKLPSKRNLSEHLKLSIITIETAYAQLVAEGYIYSIEKKGYFVNTVEETLPSSVNKANKITVAQTNPEYFLDFHTNNISSDLFPFTVWTKIMREVILEEDKRLLQPLSYNGAFGLRKAISDYLYRNRGITVDPEQIIIGAGTEYLYNLLIQLLGRDKTYAVENPGYDKISKIYRINNVSCKYIEMDKDGLSVNGLRTSGADVVHISPAHHYPTGIVMPIARRQELLKWASLSESRYVIEDDYDSEFRFSGRPIQNLLSIDESEKVIYINTFSKSLAPSIRISYMVLPPHLLEKYKSVMGFYSCTVASFEQYTLAKFITGGYFEQHISRMKNYYRRKRDSVISCFENSPFAEKITIFEENAGLHFLLKITTVLSDEEIIDLAKKESILLSCMAEYLFTPNDYYKHIFVINYSGIDIKKLPEGINRLAKLLLI